MISTNNLPKGYRPVAGFPDYRINAEGSVLSSRHARGRRTSWFEPRQFPLKDGHVLVSLQSGYKVRTKKLVHRLVLETFVGPCPDGMETRHLNGDPSDNRLANLAWGTPKENHTDKVRHGRGVRDAVGRFVQAETPM